MTLDTAAVLFDEVVPLDEPMPALEAAAAGPDGLAVGVVVGWVLAAAPPPGFDPPPPGPGPPPAFGPGGGVLVCGAAVVVGAGTLGVTVNDVWVTSMPCW